MNDFDLFSVIPKGSEMFRTRVHKEMESPSTAESWDRRLKRTPIFESYEPGRNIDVLWCIRSRNRPTRDI